MNNTNTINFDLDNKNNIINTIQNIIKKDLNFIDFIDKIDYFNEQIESNSIFYIELLKKYLNDKKFNQHFNFITIFQKYINNEENYDYKKLLIFIKKYLPFLKKDNKNIFQLISKIFNFTKDKININLFLKILDTIEIIYKLDTKIITNNLFYFNGEKMGIELKLILKDYNKLKMSEYLKTKKKNSSKEKENEVYLIFFIKFIFKQYKNDLNKNSKILSLTDITTKEQHLLEIKNNENNEFIIDFNAENWIKKKKEKDLICKIINIKKNENNIYDCYIKIVIKDSQLKFLDIKMFENFYGELYYIIGTFDYIFKNDIDFIDKIMENLNKHYDNNSHIINQLRKLENNLTTNVIDTLNNMFIIIPDYINEINEDIANEIIYNRFYDFTYFKVDKKLEFDIKNKLIKDSNNMKKKIYSDLFGNNYFYIYEDIFILNLNLIENKISFLGGFQILIPFFDVVYYKISNDEDKIKLLIKLLNLINSIYKEEYFNEFKDSYNIICMILDKFNDDIIFNEKIKEELEKFILNGKNKIFPYNNLEYKFFNKYYDFENEQKLFYYCEKLINIIYNIIEDKNQNNFDLNIEINNLNKNNDVNHYELNVINNNNEENLNLIFNYLKDILNIKKIILEIPNEFNLTEKIIFIFTNSIKINDFSTFNLYLFICYIIFLNFYIENNQLLLSKLTNNLTEIIIKCINNLTLELKEENFQEKFFIYSILYLIKSVNFNINDSIVILRKNIIEGFCKFFNEINYENSIETFEDNFLNINEENKLLFTNISSMIFIKVPFYNLSIFEKLLLNKNDEKINLNINIENYYFNFLYMFGFINKEKYNIIYNKYYYLNLYNNIFHSNIKNILPKFSETIHLNVLNYLFLPVQLKSNEIILKKLENEKQILIKFNKKSNSNNIYINETYLFINYKKIYKKYRKIKKNLFLFNGFWSDYFIEKNQDKKDYVFKILNHVTNSLKKPLLYPIFNMKNYMPNFEDLKINIDDIFIEKYINNELEINDDNFKNVKNLDIKNYLLEKYVLDPIECCLVKPAYHIKGYMVYKSDKIIFHALKNFDEDEKICYEFNSKNSHENKHKKNNKNKCFNSIFSGCNKEKYFYLKIDINNIKLMFDRIYNYKNNAIEIFLFNGKNYYFNFLNEENKEKIKKLFQFNSNFIIQEINSILNKKIFCYLNIIFYKIYYHFNNNDEINNEKNLLNFFTNSWKNFNITNFHYIMLLNIFSNRSYLDLYQYPVFPWVIFNTNKETNINNNSNDEFIIKKEDETSSIYYRPLNQSIGNIIFNNTNRRELFIDTYLILKEELEIENEEKDEEKLYIKNSKVSKLYFFNTNYSNPVYTSYYLIRLFPFTFLSIELQGGKFDTIFRLFTEYKQSCMNALYQKSDIRELIPEFYFLPEMFKNINNIDFKDKEIKKKENIKNFDVILFQIDKKFLDSHNNYQNKIFNENINYFDNDNFFNFVLFLSKKFESKFISDNLNNWINLIFGPHQKFTKKLDKNNKENFVLNIFRPESYLDNPNNIEQNERLNEILLLQSQEFGLIPLQIFNKDPQKKTNFNIDFTIIQKIYVYCQNIFPKEKPEKNNLKIQFISKKSFIAIDNTFIRVFRDYNKLNDFVFTLDFFNLDKFFYQINFKNEYVISFDINILICNGFNNGNLLLLNFNNLNNVNFSIFKYKNKNYYFSNVKITAMEIITNDKSFYLCGNEIGEIFIYLIDELKLKDKNLFNILNFFKKIDDNTDKILSISYNLDLNLFITASKDLFINIYNFPDCKLINSSQEDEIKDDKCKVFLSENPIPIKIIIKDGVIVVYSLNLINKNYKNEHKIISKKNYTEDFNIDSINALMIKTPNLEDCLLILGNKKDNSIENYKNYLLILELPTLNEYNFDIEFKNNSNSHKIKNKNEIIINDYKSKNENEIDLKNEKKNNNKNQNDKKNFINSISFLPSLKYLTLFNSINKEIRVLYLKTQM